MAHKEFSRIAETSASTGAGDLVLDGAIAGLRAIGDVHADGSTFHAVIAMDADWEIDKLTYHAGTNSVTRTQVFASSNAGAAVNWGAGDKVIKEVVVGAGDLDAAGKSSVRGLLATTFKATKTSAQTIMSTIKTKVTWQTEAWDIGGHFASSSWTPPAGKYLIAGSLHFASVNGVDQEQLAAHVYVGGAEQHAVYKRRSGTGVEAVPFAFYVDVNGAQAIDIYATKNGSGDGEVSANTINTFVAGSAI